MKHRKAELAQERGGLIASIGQTIAGPRFHENDEVQSHPPIDEVKKKALTSLL